MGTLRKLSTEANNEANNGSRDFKDIYNSAHARCRLAAKMDALRKLITEENNGSRDAPTTGSSRDADSR